MIEAHRRGFANTDGNAKVANLLLCLCYCAKNGSPVPEWAEAPFTAAVMRWLILEAATLDEAFGAVPRKHVRAKRNRLDATAALYDALDRRGFNAPHDWHAIAEETGFGHTLLEQIYRGDDIMRELFPGKMKNRGETRR